MVQVQARPAVLGDSAGQPPMLFDPIFVEEKLFVRTVELPNDRTRRLLSVDREEASGGRTVPVQMKHTPQDIAIRAMNFVQSNPGIGQGATNGFSVLLGRQEVLNEEPGLVLAESRLVSSNYPVNRFEAYLRSSETIPKIRNDL
jgi:hypothetical protein